MVIGGGRAAYAAAAELRRHRGNLQVVVLERGAEPGADTVGVPHRMSSGGSDFVGLAPLSMGEQRDRRHVDVRANQHVLGVDLAAGSVLVSGEGRRSDLTLRYDHLLFATGGRARRPNLPGADGDRLVSVRSVIEAQQLLDQLSEVGARHVSILGGDYISLLLAEALVMRGLAVTVLSVGEQILPELSGDFGAVMAEAVAKHEVTVRAGEQVSGFETGVVYLGNDAVTTDLVVLGLGTEPNTDLARDAGMPLGHYGGIVTDRRQQSEVANVWAAGDCCETKHAVTGERGHYPGAAAAENQGRVAGANIAGSWAATAGTLGTMRVRAFGTEAARTGLHENEARSAGFDAVATTVHGLSRAETHAGAKPLACRIVHDRASGRLLGAEFVGKAVSASLTTAVTAITAGLTVGEVADLDLGHAPSLGSLPSPIVAAATQATT